MATISEVKKVFLERRAEIDALDQGLTAERRRIQKEAFLDGRPMTADEKARRTKIGATKQELADALLKLALGSLDDLNSSEEVAQLNKELAEINEMLADDLAELKKMAEYAETAAKLMSGLASAVGKVASIVLPG